MQKRLVAVVLLLCTLFSLNTPLANAEGSLAVNIKFGFDNEVSSNEISPIFVEVTNNGSDFVGDFVYDNEEMYTGGTGIVRTLDIKAGEQQSFTFYIKGFAENYLATSAVKKQIHIFEGGIDKGKEVKLDLQQIKSPKVITSDVKQVLAITTDKQYLEVLKPATVYNLKVAQAENADSPRLTNNVLDYDMYEIIALDESGVKLLADDQLQAIEQWQKLGGTLLLIGDVTSEYWPSPLTFNEDSVTVAENATVKVDNFGQNRLVATLKQGSGAIVQSSFSLTDTALTEDIKVNSIVTKALNLTPTNEYYSNYFASDWIYDNGLFETFYYNTRLILAFLILYVIVVGPLLYVFLKKRDKREKMWLYIPLIAVVASVLLFAFGAKDRITKPQSQTAEVVALNGQGDATVHTAFSFLSNKKDDYEVTTSQQAFTIASLDNFNAETQSIQEKVYTTEDDEQQTLTFKDVPYWSVKSAVSEQTMQSVGKLNSDLRIENNRLIGTITNDLPTGLSDVQLLSGNNIVSLGAILAGETMSVDQEVPFSLALKPLYYTGYDEDVSLKTQKRVLIERKNMLIRTTTNMYNSTDPLLLGFATEQLSPITLKKNSTHSSLTMYAQPTPVKTVVSGEVTLHSSDFTPTLTPVNPQNYGEVYNDSNVLQGSISEGDYILHFELADGFDKEQIDWENIEVAANPSELNVEIFNANTNEYEPISSSPWEQFGSVTKYINDSNEVQLKISTIQEYYGSLIDMPTFKLKGVAK